MSVMRKRPRVDLVDPYELGELGRDLAFADERIEELKRQEVALVEKFKRLRLELRQEREYLEVECKQLRSAIIYQFKLTPVSYEEEARKAIEALTRIEEEEEIREEENGIEAHQTRFQ